MIMLAIMEAIKEEIQEQKHRMDSIEIAHQEILKKLNDLARVVESLAAASAASNNLSNLSNLNQLQNLNNLSQLTNQISNANNLSSSNSSSTTSNSNNLNREPNSNNGSNLNNGNNVAAALSQQDPTVAALATAQFLSALGQLNDPELLASAQARLFGGAGVNLAGVGSLLGNRLAASSPPNSLNGSLGSPGNQKHQSSDSGAEGGGSVAGEPNNGGLNLNLSNKQSSHNNNNTTTNNLNSSSNNNLSSQVGGSAGATSGPGGQLVHSIPHPHSHHALSHPTASLLMSNPHYQTVRTKYSTRRYSRRRVGPEEAMADPAIRSTAQLTMPVVPKTILIVLKHRLTVQTAITLACFQTGERLRKGAIQKKLEAMFREPGAVDAFLAEWDHHPR